MTERVATKRIPPLPHESDENELYRSIFENFNTATVIINNNGDIKDANAAFRDLVSKRDAYFAPDSSLFDFIIPADHKRISDALATDFTPAPELPYFETALVSFETKLKRVRIYFSPLPDFTKKIATIVEKRKNALSTNEMNQRAEDLEHLFYLISHNLKSPIVSIQGFARLLLEHEDQTSTLGDDNLRYLERIRLNADKMSVMIQDILTFARVTRTHFKPEKVALSVVLDNIRAECFFKIKEKKIDFVVASDLPMINVDPDGIFTVFHNLIENAIKYIGQPETPKIEVGWEEKPRFFVFWVSDNGPGVPEKFQETVFELFERGLAPGSSEGTGVGLAVVKRIIDKHGGYVRLTSTQGKGTRVYFTIPKVIRKS